MKPVTLFILMTVLALGFYLNTLDPNKDSQVLIEDKVDSKMAAPQKTEIPL